MPSLRLIRRRLDPLVRHVTTLSGLSVSCASIVRGYTTGFGKTRDPTPRAPAGAGRPSKRTVKRPDTSSVHGRPVIRTSVNNGVEIALSPEVDEVAEASTMHEISVTIRSDEIIARLKDFFATKTGSAPELLEIVHPLIQARMGSHDIQPYILPITQTLSQYYTSLVTIRPSRATQKSLSEVMLWCLSNAPAPTGDIKGKSRDDGGGNEADQIEDCVGRVMIHLGVNASDAERKGLLTRLAQHLSGVKGFDLGISLVAALAVLSKDIPLSHSIRCVWPSGRSISEYLDGVFMNLGIERESSDYADTIHSLLTRKTVPDLPQSIDSLRSRLTQIVREGNEEEVITLYQVFLAYQNIPHPHKSPPSALVNRENTREILTRFLYALTSPKYGGSPPRQGAKLEMMTQDLLGRMGKPWGLEVWHSLIAHRARAQEDAPVLEGGEVVVSMGEYDNRVTGEVRERRGGVGIGRDGVKGRGMVDKVELSETRKEAALKKLWASWEQMSEEGVGRDVKVYMLMIEGLGRLGDLKGLQTIWNEMANDADCAESHRREVEDPTATFPPTRALNHMISACLLVPRVGPPVALELFNQACSPDSTIPCNLITINTMLRHHARQADVPAMKNLFLLASKLNLTPDEITYTTLVQGLLRAGAVEQAKVVLDSMSARGIQTSERMCSLLVADLSKGGSSSGLARAEEMMNEMRRRGLEIDAITWTGLIGGYFRGGWESDAWEAVRRMEGTGLRLNRVAYNIILKEAGRDARAGEGVLMRVFEKMVKEGTEPNSDTYYIVLGTLVGERRWEQAEEVVGEMKDRGFVAEKGNLQRLVRQVQAKR